MSLLIGNLLPDLDFIFIFALYIFNPELALSLHRSVTHNFFFPVIIFLFFAIIAQIKKKKQFYSLGLGIAIGIVTHIILDVLFWFDHVQVLWPLDLVGISSETDFWGWIGVSVTEKLALFLGPTAEFLLYSLLFGFLWYRIKQSGTPKRLAIFPLMMITSLAVYCALIILVFHLPAERIIELSYGLGASIWGVITIWLIVKYRKSIFSEG
jgi:membrane-bound metal-dependent hydrolase YbcI (DUF457 family)